MFDNKKWLLDQIKENVIEDRIDDGKRDEEEENVFPFESLLKDQNKLD